MKTISQTCITRRKFSTAAAQGLVATSFGGGFTESTSTVKIASATSIITKEKLKAGFAAISSRKYSAERIMPAFAGYKK